MSTTRATMAPFSIGAILAAASLAGACDGSATWNPLPPAEEEAWEWADLSGPAAPTPELVSNHEPLAIVGGDLLLGTADGFWRRPLAGNADWQRAGLEGRAIHALARTADGTRLVAAGFDPRDASAPTAWYSTSGGLDWTPAATWPRGAPGRPDAGISFRFATLEPDPLDANVLYGGLDADSIAVTVDGGATWLMTDGALSPNFGYACVPHRPRGANVLLQGCELPLDVAWIGARNVSANDRLTLTSFRYLFGYPDLAALGNRRINSIATPSGREDRVLVGVEGGLLELTATDGGWTTGHALDARWVYLSNGDDPRRPYAYIRAIAPLSADGRHVLFGGTVNGTNEELSLFETSGGGAVVRRVAPPSELDDPRVEQAVRIGSTDVLLVVSVIDAQERRSPRVFRLRRP